MEAFQYPQCSGLEDKRQKQERTDVGVQAIPIHVAHGSVEMNSYGFDGETGKKLAGSSGPSRFSSQAYGPVYSTGDVVGAGILLETQEMFFT